MKLYQSIALLAAGAALIVGLAGCSQATADTAKTAGPAAATTVGAVKTSIYDLSSTAGKGWTGGGTTFSTDNSVPALNWTTAGWAPLTGPTLSPVLDASKAVSFSVALKGTWTGGSYMAIKQGFRIGLFDNNGIETDFDIDTATLPSGSFKAFSFDTASPSGVQGHGSTATFSWNSITRVDLFDMGGSGTLTITNLGFN